MELITAATLLYEAISKEKPKTDVMFLEFQQFMVTHFNHAGTLAMRGVDENNTVSHAVAPQQGVRMQAFKHPLSQAKPVAKEIVKGGKVSKSDVLKKKREVEIPEGELGEESGHEENQHQNDGVAAGDVANGTEQPDTVISDGEAEKVANEPQQISIDFIKATRAKGIGEAYKREALIDFITLKGVTLTGNESNTQLGGIVKNLVNA